MYPHKLMSLCLVWLTTNARDPYSTTETVHVFAFFALVSLFLGHCPMYCCSSDRTIKDIFLSLLVPHQDRSLGDVYIPYSVRVCRPLSSGRPPSTCPPTFRSPTSHFQPMGKHYQCWCRQDSPGENELLMIPFRSPGRNRLAQESVLTRLFAGHRCRRRRLVNHHQQAFKPPGIIQRVRY